MTDREWVEVDGTRTQYVGVPAIHLEHGIAEGALATLVLAYPTSHSRHVPAPTIVRLDFPAVWFFGFGSDWTLGEAGTRDLFRSGGDRFSFVLSELPESPLVRWATGDDVDRPLRHYVVTFDQLGDLAIISEEVQKFDLVQPPGVDTSGRGLLDFALSAGPIRLDGQDPQ